MQAGSARSFITLAFGLSLLFVSGGALHAQDRADNSHGLNESDAQNWARNWAQSWQERLENRASKFQKLTRWQVSEQTLISFYGQINAGFLRYNDSVEEIETLRDNPNSPSRIGIRVDTDLKDGGQLFANFEAAAPKSNYNSVFSGGVGSGGGSDWNKRLIRKAELRWTSPRLGHFSFGQGSMAADGITGFDFSGTGIVAYNGVGDTVSGIPARQNDGTESAFNVSSFFPTFDASRRLRVRYDSLARNDISVAIAVGREVLMDNNDNTYADIALRYETSWRGFGIRGGLGYSYNGSAPGYLSGSVAGLDKNTGLNFALALGANTRSGRYGYLKLGWTRQFFQQGPTSFSLDYYSSSNPQPTASASSSWGVAIVQGIEVRDWDLFATYREYSIDGSSESYLDSKAILFGARIFW